MRLTNDYKKLFVIVSLIVGFLLSFYFIATLTQIEKQPALPQRMDLPSRDVITTDSTEDRLIRVEERLKELEEAVNYTYTAVASMEEQYTSYMDSIKEDVRQSMTAESLYINYAYEISAYSYPNIDPEYVCAIIYHESRFDPNTQNEKTDARGLAQIRPKWHSERAQRLGVTNLYDPHGNILVCFDILSEQTEKHNFEYALNLFAGGYPYANRYKNSTSPFVKELNEIIETQNFQEQALTCYLQGGEIGAAG